MGLQLQSTIRDSVNAKAFAYINDTDACETDLSEASFGVDARFPWYLDWTSLLPLEKARDYLTDSCVAPAENTVADLDRRRAALEEFAYNASTVVFKEGVDAVSCEPPPQLLAADSNHSLHASVGLADLYALFFYKMSLPGASEEVLSAMPAALTELAASSVLFALDLDLLIPNIQLHAIRVLDVMSGECWLDVLEAVNVSSSFEVGEVEEFAVRCTAGQEAATCTPAVHAAQARVAGWGAAQKQEVAAIASDIFTSMMSMATNGAQYCGSEVFKPGESIPCPACPDWMQPTGEAVCVPSENFSQDCAGLRNGIARLDQLVFGRGSNDQAASDAWLEPERSLPNDPSTDYLDLNNSLFTETLAGMINASATSFSVANRSVLSAPRQLVYVSSDGDILPGHGLNITVDAISVTMGPISAVHFMQACLESAECADYGFSLGSGPPSRRTLWHTATIDQLEIGIDASVINLAYGTSQTDSVHIGFAMQNLTGTIATMAAFNLTAIEKMNFAPLLNQDEDTALACALTGAISLGVGHLSAHVDATSAPDIQIAGNPLRSPATSLFASGAAGGLCLADPILRQHLPALLEMDGIRTTINGAIDEYLSTEKVRCTHASAPVVAQLRTPAGLLNFTALLAPSGAAHDYCEVLLRLDNSSNASLTWDGVRCAFQANLQAENRTEWPHLLRGSSDSSSVVPSEPIANLTGEHVELLVHETAVRGLEHGYDVSLLAPVDDQLRSALTLGSSEEPVEVELSVRIGTSTGGFLRDLLGHVFTQKDSGFAAVSKMASDLVGMSNPGPIESREATLTLSFFGMRAFVDAQLSIDLQNLVDLTVAQLVNLQCWRGIFVDSGLFFGLDIGSLSVQMDCDAGACDCNAYAASAAHNQVTCAFAGSCVWADGECSPDWMAKMKSLWDNADTNRRFAESLEGVVGSLSGVLNADALAVPTQIAGLRQHATELYTIFGANEASSPVTVADRNVQLLEFENLVHARMEREHSNAQLSNLNDNAFVQLLQGKLVNLTEKVQSALPPNITKVLSRPIPTPFNRSFHPETWLERFNHGLFDGPEQEETQEWILESVSLTGLDSLEEFELLQSTQGNLTWIHECSIREIGIVVNLTLHATVETPPDEWNAWWSCAEESSSTTSSVVITTRLANVGVEFATLLAVDLDALHSTPMGKILNQPLGCLLSSVRAFDVNFVNVSFGDDCLLEPQFETAGDPLPPLAAKLAK